MHIDGRFSTLDDFLRTCFDDVEFPVDAALQIDQHLRDLLPR
jgi:hypothetical protein